MKTHCRKGHNLSEVGTRKRINRGKEVTECLSCIKSGQERRYIKYQQIPNYSRDVHLKSRYGITSKDFNALFLLQNKCCAICTTQVISKRGFVVDHDHSTNKIRGILCDSCNKGLGSFLDNEEILSNAIKYLKKSRI